MQLHHLCSGAFHFCKATQVSNSNPIDGVCNFPQSFTKQPETTLTYARMRWIVNQLTNCDAAQILITENTISECYHFCQVLLEFLTDRGGLQEFKRKFALDAILLLLRLNATIDVHRRMNRFYSTLIVSFASTRCSSNISFTGGNPLFEHRLLPC